MPHCRDPESPLSPREARFCEEYLLDLNGTYAAGRAGFSTKGTNARTTASRLLALPRIQARINELMAKRSEKVEIRAEEVLLRLYEIATVDPAEIYNEAGLVRPIHEIPEAARRAISAIDTSEIVVDGNPVGQVRKVKLVDKAKALELIGRNLKLFTDRVEVSADASFAEALKAARERVAKR